MTANAYRIGMPAVAAIALALAAGNIHADQPADQESQATTQQQSSRKADSAGASTAGTTRSGTAEKTVQSALPPGHPPVTYLIVPVQAPEQETWMQKGCWARFHDGKNYAGDSLTLIGPVDMKDMTGPFGINWKNKISSIQTGPKTRVLVYDDAGFKDLVATFKPGQNAPEVSKQMGYFEEFSSMKIACDNIQASAPDKASG